MDIPYLVRAAFLTGSMAALGQATLLSQVNSGQAATLPSNLEAIAQTATIPHKQEGHAEFFRDIVTKVQNLNRNGVPYNSGQYKELFDALINDYGLPIKSSDILSVEVMKEAMEDVILITFRGIPGPKESKLENIWIYPSFAMPVFVGKGGSLLPLGKQDLYNPRH